MVAVTHSGANVSRRRKTSGVKRSCDWCGERFKQSRSDQRYCCGNCRRAACDHRRKQTIQTIADTFAPYGLRYEHARDCADADLARLGRVLVMLGLAYDEARKEWIRPPLLR